MTNRLEALEDWASGLLEQLEPAARNRLVRSLGHALRKSQQQRIITQRNPDGSKYPPRKQRNLRGKKERVKRKVQMFQKLRTASFLKVNGDGNAISVGFKGRIARIARVHQFGLKDRAERSAADIKYEQRKVLGFSDADLDLIREEMLTYPLGLPAHISTRSRNLNDKFLQLNSTTLSIQLEDHTEPHIVRNSLLGLPCKM